MPRRKKTLSHRNLRPAMSTPPTADDQLADLPPIVRGVTPDSALQGVRIIHNRRATLHVHIHNADGTVETTTFKPPPEPKQDRWPGTRQALEMIAEQNRELLAAATPGTKRYRILERLQRQAETALKRHSNDRSQQ